MFSFVIASLSNILKSSPTIVGFPYCWLSRSRSPFFQVESLWVNGRYDPESGSAGVGGLGSLGISIDGSEVKCVGGAWEMLHPYAWIVE